MDKVDEMIKEMIKTGDLKEPPLAFEYYTVLLWQSKSMDRQCREKLHLITRKLSEKKKSKSNSPDIDLLSTNKNSLSENFWLFGTDIDDQLKVVFFELSRLYMRNKDYRSGYKVLKNLIELIPTDVDALIRIAKY